MWKHEALLSFVDRLIKDSEFREWYASEPSAALASYGLNGRELRDLEGAILEERRQPEVAEALRPLVQLMIQVSEAKVGRYIALADGGTSEGAEVYERLTVEVELVRERLDAAEKMRPRQPWWKFWQ